ncbi:MAG: cytochrome c oxidase subunit 2, partial [Candidatus Arcticimaribacter sp.]
MTAILTITVLVLIAISLWQVAKIFEMSQTSKNNSQVANDSD